MNKKAPEDVTDHEMKYCWEHTESCPTQRCHDRLRDQQTTVEIETFNETWSEIAESLRGTVVIDDG
jgi:hypothetical protein